MGKRGILFYIILTLGLLSGCSQQEKSASAQIFAMDTIMSLSAYGENSQEKLDEATQLIYELEDILSVTDEGSDVWALNHADGDWVTVSPHTLYVVQQGILLAEETGGAIDPTIYPAMTAWGFTTGDYQVPDQAVLDQILSLVDYSKIEIDEENLAIRIPAGMQLDLGALAKGYSSDLVAEILSDVDYAVISLGGNAYVIGQKPDGDPWRVGIQSPEDDSYLAIVSPDGGNAVITSGGYQRYFEENGQTYWHILDPATASPVQSDLVSVTVIGEDGLICDGLSTALFVMGLETACDFWRSQQNQNLDFNLNFDMILVDSQGTVYVTESIYDSFTLADGVVNPVEVIS